MIAFSSFKSEENKKQVALLEFKFKTEEKKWLIYKLDKALNFSKDLTKKLPLYCNCESLKINWKSKSSDIRKRFFFSKKLNFCDK